MAIATAETVSGTATSASSISAASWTPGANDLILVWVACRSTVTVSSVSGNGITFVQVLSDTEGTQAQCTLSLWRGMSGSPSTGQITATLSGTANAAVIVAHRITGADTGGTNGSGAIGASAIANTGATDTASPSVSVTTTAANSRVYGGATHRNQTYTVGSGETAITLNVTAGTAGDVTSISTEYQDVATPSSVTINGTLANATDWIQGAVEVLAAPTTVTGSASLTQGADTLAADGAVALSGAASLTQGTDSASAAGAVAILGAASLTQGTDSASAAGAVAIQGTASLTQGADTLAADGGLAAILGDASLTQGAQTSAGAGVVAIAGAASLTQGAQTSAGAGAVATQGAASLTQGADVLSADGTRGVAFAPWAQHTFPITADDLARTTRRDTTFTIEA